jgi:hypothetical protein
MNKKYRVYNHTDHELIISTDEQGEKQYRLLGQSVSPVEETPRLLWAASKARIDGELLWQLDEGCDVHVSETGPGVAPLGSGPLDPTPDLHISGLGTHPIPKTEPPRPAPTRQAWFCREDEIWVTVLGAGITGLTVAHELVTRGFRVQVIERAHGSPADIRDHDTRDHDTGMGRFHRGLTTPDVGGIARTQWGTQPRGPAAAPSLGGTTRTGSTGASTPYEPAELASLRSVHGDAVWFGHDKGGPRRMGNYHAFGVTWTGDRIDDFAAELHAWLRERGSTGSVAGVQLVVVVYDGEGSEHVERAYERLRELLRVLEPSHPDTRDEAVKELCATLDRLQVLPTARIDVAESERPESHVGLFVRVHDDLGLIAGEHGFRFFPGFYRHLRDTLVRTPIFDPVTRTFTSRTAHDNLQEVEWQVVADPERPYKAALSRKPFVSIGGLIEQYRAIRRDLGYRPIDLLRFSLRVLRYMTSSTRRREAYYEKMSWWTFLSKPHLDQPGPEPLLEYDERFAEALRHAPKALVAMSSEYADARTQGNLNVQLLMDQFEWRGQSDSTLAGPTSTSWFTHWRKFLEEQGVRFFLGEVTEIAVEGADATTQRANVKIVFPHGTPAEYLDGEAARKEVRIGTHYIDAHYIVSALDVVGLARVTRGLRSSPGAGVLGDLHELVGDDRGRDRDLEDITKIGRGGPDDGLGDRFQTLTGIQLYYQRHVSFANGHIYFASSPWGLSALSQIQFWGPFGSGHRGRLTGNLSVDIGSWRSHGSDRDPNGLDRDAIAAEVQRQIHDSTKPPRGGTRVPPRASLYHLDDFIGFAPAEMEDGSSRIVPRRNHAPFLINVVGDWERRPRGTPWTPNDLSSRDREPGSGTLDGTLWTPERGGYVVHYGNLVIAGPHMRTFTRMATMEAANESARHAVNAILDHATWTEGRRRPEPATQVTDFLERDRGLTARRPTQTPSINVNKRTTPFGDYCDIFDPELFEFEDLQFLRSIDSHLMDAGTRRGGGDSAPGGDDAQRGGDPPPAPHLFDILRIDELPDRLEDDRDAINALEVVGCILAAFNDAQIGDLSSVLAVVESARKQLASLLARAAG